MFYLYLDDTLITVSPNFSEIADIIVNEILVDCIDYVNLNALFFQIGVDIGIHNRFAYMLDDSRMVLYYGREI